MTKHYLVTVGGVYGNGDILSLCAGERELREALQDIRNRDYCGIYGEYWCNVITPLKAIIRDKWAHLQTLPIAYRSDSTGFYALCVQRVSKSEYETLLETE